MQHGDRTDDQIRADAGGLELDAGFDAGTDNQRHNAGELFDRACKEIGQLRNHRGDDCAVEGICRNVMQFQNRFAADDIFEIGFVPVGVHPFGKCNPVILRTADDDIGVADVHGQDLHAFTSSRSVSS